MAKNVQNPGSALGEAIGANMESALNEYLIDFVKEYENDGEYFWNIE